MKTVTNGFKEQITQLGREIDFKIFLHTNDKIITEDGKFLMTQDNLNLIVEQFNENEIDETITGEDIYNVSLVNKGTLLSTMMKEFDFEIKQDLRVGDLVDCSFGLKVNDSYEYVNYGRYIVYSKEFNEDTKTYSYIGYDPMLLTMQEIPDTSVFENVDLYTAMQTACNTVGITVPSKMYLQTHNLYWSNFDKVINEGTFTDLQMTYRDLLDMICQALGMSMIVNGKQLQLKPLKNTNIGGQPFIIVDTFDENFMKDINVSFGKKYGPINSVVLSRSEDSDNIYRRDEQSIEENGLCEFKIKDNPIMLYDDREDYIQEIFNALKGTEFYINDFNSTGITYLDWLDFYNVEIGDKTYKCLMLNDEIKIQQGLEETVYTEEPEETTTDYKTSSKTDKEVSFIVDKQNGSIRAKVNKGEVINEINLDETGAEINAEKISLAGKEIKLTTDDITISSTNFNVDSDGNMVCNNANVSGTITSSNAIITGGSINVKRSAGSGAPAFMEIIDDNFNGKIETMVTSGIIELNNYSTDMGATIEPQVRLYSTVLGSTNLGAGGCYSPEFVPTSLEENKKNFELLDSGLRIIKNIDIYKYHLKGQNDEDKKHIGFVIGNNFKYCQEVTSNENNGADLYGFVSVCCKAIQEQQEQINSLKEEIKQLKESDK